MSHAELVLQGRMGWRRAYARAIVLEFRAVLRKHIMPVAGLIKAILSVDIGTVLSRQGETQSNPIQFKLSAPHDMIHTYFRAHHCNPGKKYQKERTQKRTIRFHAQPALTAYVLFWQINAGTLAAASTTVTTY